MHAVQKLQSHADHIKRRRDDQWHDRGVQSWEADDEVVVLGETVAGIEVAVVGVLLLFSGEVVEEDFFGGLVAGPVSDAGGCEGEEGCHKALVVSA